MEYNEKLECIFAYNTGPKTFPDIFIIIALLVILVFSVL